MEPEKARARPFAGAGDKCSSDAGRAKAKTQYLVERNGNGMREIIHKKLKQASKENPFDRHKESKRLGTDERTIRLIIQTLRMEGVRICADSSGKGYWIAESEADYKRFRAEYISRASNIFKVVSAMDGVTEGQIRW